MVDYDLETGRVLEEIKALKAKRVGLQFPEGLKDKAVDVAGKIEEETDAMVVIFTDATFGACDLKPEQAEKLGIDLLIHYGHTEFKE